MSEQSSNVLANSVSLRDVLEGDLPIFFEQQLDPNANYMAAFTAKDPTDKDAFMRHWTSILGDETNTTKTILFDGQIAGNIACYQDEELGQPEIGYWIGKPYWGKGIATEALLQLLDYFKARPVYARVAKDNPASLRVLQKCGFTICGENKGFANARGQEIEEFIMRLEESKDTHLPSSSNATQTYQSLRVERDAFVANVILTGPGKGNAMGPDFWRELPQVFEMLDQDEQVRVIVIRGNGQHFTYGLDLVAMQNEFRPLLSQENNVTERTRFLETVSRMQQAVTSLALCRKPVVAAVTGWCIGGGLDLIAACDIRLCSQDARFSLREVKVAMVADIGSLQRLPSIIGQGHLRDLAFTGKDIDAAHALRIGLINEVYETQQALYDATHSLALQIAENSPLVVQGIKQVLNDAQEPAIAEELRHVALWNAAFLQSHDLVEAFTAFMQRRTPHYEGK